MANKKEKKIDKEKENYCVGRITEDWYKAERYITYAHKVTARAYWVFIIFVIALACNIIGIFNHHFSTRSHFSKYEDPIRGWYNFMKNENLFISDFKYLDGKNGEEAGFRFTYSSFGKRKTDSLNFIEYKNDTLMFNTVLEYIPDIAKYKSDSLTKSDSLNKAVLVPSNSIGYTINFKKYKIIDIDLESENTCIIKVKKKDLDYFYPIPINPTLTSRSQAEEFEKQSLKLEYINIPIIGITISVEDFFIIMSFTFFLLSWFLKYTIKAENLTIGKILTIFNKKSVDLKELMFYGIVFNNLFFPTTQRKKPYEKLKEIEKTLTNVVNDMPDKSSPKFKNSLNWIYFVPTVICGVNLIMYVWGVVSFNLAGTFLWYFIIIGFIGLICGAGVFRYNLKTYQYQKGTNKILHEFKQNFKHDKDIKNNIDNSVEKEMVVAIVNSDVIYKKEYNDRKKEFCNKYNDYFLLTHTSDNKELDRILKLIKENPDKFFKNNYKKPIQKEDDKEFINDGKSEYIENFIFIKKYDNGSDKK